MKQLILVLFAAFTLAACSSPEEKLLDIINDATEQVRNAKTIEEATRANEEFTRRIDEFGDKHADDIEALRKDKKKSAAIEAAMQQYVSVSLEKAMELGSE